MSYKISLILSMIFVALFFLFGIDLISIQFAFSSLDSQSINVSYLISNHGTIDEDFINHVETRFDLDFTCLSNCNPQFGDIVEYTLSRQINTLVITKGPMDITIKRSAVIGYYS